MKIVFNIVAINLSENEIDRLVYRLYDLSAEEIEIFDFVFIVLISSIVIPPLFFVVLYIAIYNQDII